MPREARNYTNPLSFGEGLRRSILFEVRRSEVLASGANKFIETGRFWYFLRLQKVRRNKFLGVSRQKISK